MRVEPLECMTCACPLAWEPGTGLGAVLDADAPGEGREVIAWKGAPGDGLPFCSPQCRDR